MVHISCRADVDLSLREIQKCVSHFIKEPLEPQFFSSSKIFCNRVVLYSFHNEMFPFVIGLLHRKVRVSHRTAPPSPRSW